VTADETARLREILLETPWLLRALVAVRHLDLPDWAISAGALRNAVWDRLHGYREPTPLRDVDVVFFDPSDLSAERDQRIQATLFHIMPVLPWEVTNQAAVHQWFPAYFGYAVEPFASTEEAIAHNPETATSVGVRLDPDGELQILAPCGVADLLGLVLRHNPARATRDLYLRRLRDKRIRETWPRVRVVL